MGCTPEWGMQHKQRLQGRCLGLKKEYYYDNIPQSMRHNLKMRQNYKASNMPTVVEIILKKKDV